MMRRLVSVALVATLVSGLAYADPIIDGSIAGDGYSLGAVQTVQTQFGDNLSELNAAYYRIESGKLFLGLTGNLENNFNKLNIFIDSTAGGQNVIDGGNNPPNDGWAAKYSGLTFDSGFAPDYMVILRHGFDGTNNRFDVDYAIIGGGVNDGELIGTFDPTVTNSATVGPGGLTGVSMDIGFDNSNAAGIGGGDGAADQGAALAVETGIELAIDLADIGSPTGAFRISAHVNGSNHDYLSNQSLGGYEPPQGNLGGDGNGTFTGDLSQIDFNNFVGDQYFVVPEPGAMALIAVGCLALRRRRN